MLRRGSRPRSIGPRVWLDRRRGQVAGGAGGAQGLKKQDQVTAAQRLARVGVRHGYGAERLEQEHDVGRGYVGAQSPIALGPVVDSRGQRSGPLSQFRQVGGGGEGAGQALGQGLAAAVEDPGQAVGVDGPGIAVVGQGAIEFGDVADQPVVGQLSQQVILAGVTPVQGTDPDLGPAGDGGDGGGGIGQEDLAGRGQDLDVVAGCLPAPPAERAFCLAHAMTISLERNDLICYTGTVHSVPTDRAP